MAEKGSTNSFLKEIGTASEIKAEANGNPTLAKPIVSNSHIHIPPNFSAFETIGQAVELAAAEEINVLGTGNYYDFSVYEGFADECLAKNIFPLFSTEIIALEKDLQANNIRVNDPGNPGKYYICGKSITRFEKFTTRAAELNKRIRDNDAKRMAEMTAKMADYFAKFGIDTKLDEKAVIARVVKRHNCKPETVTLQERHLAQAFQEVLCELVAADERIAKLSEVFGVESKSAVDDAVGIQNEIRSYLMKAGKPCFVEESFVTLAEAQEYIAELGGIACYPTLADGSKVPCEYESPVENLIETLKKNNFPMLEFIPNRNTPEVLEQYVTAVRNAGLVVIAGTEHNTLALDPIEPQCVGGKDIPAKVQEIFHEGICVLAAHQYLCANGEDGFPQQYANATDKDAVIEEFKKIGIVVLNRYNG